MPFNQYRGREGTDRINFKKKSPEEQMEISKENITEEQDENPVNENLPQEGKEKLEKEQSRRVA